MTIIHTRLFWAIATTMLLAACGGGSGGLANNDNDSLSGTAAIGAAITNGTVTAKCSDGSGFDVPVITDDQGRWSVDIDSDALPCALRVSGGTPNVTLHSYAQQNGTANITPLTDLVIAYASSSMPDDWFDNDGTLGSLDAAIDDLLGALATAGFSLPGGSFDPFRTGFSATAGDTYDDFLELLAQAIADDGAIADYDALLTLMKDGNLGSLPDAPEGGDGGIEDPEDELSLLTDYAGTYTVECTAVEPAARGFTTRERARGSSTIGADGSIDFDSGAEFNFSAEDIGDLFDRTMLEGDIRRIHINYDADDSGRRIDIYLDDALEITEIRYQDGEGGRTRAAIGGSENCSQES